MKYEKSCGAVIVNDGKVLVIQQEEGHWAFPKGHVEGSETEVETAVREIKEETGLDVEINDSFRYVERYSPKEDVEKDVVFFVAKVIGGDICPQEGEVKQIEWLSIEEAMERLTYDTAKRVLNNVVRDLGL